MENKSISPKRSTLNLSPYVLQENITRINSTLSKPTVNLKLLNMKRKYLNDTNNPKIPKSFSFSFHPNKLGSPAQKSMKSARSPNVKQLPLVNKKITGKRNSCPPLQSSPQEKGRKKDIDTLKQIGASDIQSASKNERTKQRPYKILRRESSEATLNCIERSFIIEKPFEKMSQEVSSSRLQAYNENSPRLRKNMLPSLKNSSLIIKRSLSQPGGLSLQKGKSIHDSFERSMAIDLQNQLNDMILAEKKRILKDHRQIDKAIQKNNKNHEQIIRNNFKVF